MRAPLLCLSLTLLACPSEAPTPGTPDPESPDWCTDGRAQARLTDDASQPMGVYPDDHWTRSDASTRTGLRVDLDPSEHPELLGDFPPEWHSFFATLSELDGWGLTSGIVFRFEFALDPATVTSDAVHVVAFEPAGPVLYRADVAVTEFPDTVIVRPRRPLPPATEVAVLLDAGITSGDGSCVRPTDHLRALLAPETDAVDGIAPSLSPRYVAALDATGVDPERVVHATVFTTQSTPMQSLAVRDDVASRSYTAQDPSCTPEGDGSFDCSFMLTVQDYRRADRTVDPDFDGTPEGTYDLPVRVVLPDDPADGPYPAGMVGHGLNSSRNNLSRAIPELNDLGRAALATDALQHGDHPDRDPGDSITTALNFFAIETSPIPTIRAAELRDNFRQSSWDRIQVLEAVRQGLDLDGDGDADLLADDFVYYGASLGGMMGTETMALSPDIRGAMLGTAGGRVTQIVTGGTTYASLLGLMIPDGYGDEDLERIVPVIQAIADPGDPMFWARYLVNERLVGDATDPPQVLALYTFEDSVVPNLANRNHAHGLGLPLIGEGRFALEELEPIPAPLTGNLPNGGTAAIQVVGPARPDQDPDAEPVQVDHTEALWTWEAWSVWRPFLEAVANGETATIEDLYEVAR